LAAAACASFCMDTKYGLVSVFSTRVTPTFLPEGTAPDGRAAALDAAPEVLLEPPAAEAALLVPAEEPPAALDAALEAALEAPPAALLPVDVDAPLLLDEPQAAAARTRPAETAAEATRRERGRKLLDIRSPFDEAPPWGRRSLNTELSTGGTSTYEKAGGRARGALAASDRLEVKCGTDSAQGVAQALFCPNSNDAIT
jgi:hypothetical protein